MAIDLNKCVGCNNCIVACQSENNIAVVGKEQTMKGPALALAPRGRLLQRPARKSKGVAQPVPCMQCEDAPCELVCPVQATTHSSEGLNDMVYNRCVGTRYCSNNCPYKVRRFNPCFSQDWDTPQFKLMRNPDVTVRSRGVMEKCTYCVQQITSGALTPRRADTTIKEKRSADGLPAVVSGGRDRVRQPQRSEQPGEQVEGAGLGTTPLLGELNTRPRTTYLAEVRNPNPSSKSQNRVEVIGTKAWLRSRSYEYSGAHLRHGYEHANTRGRQASAGDCTGPHLSPPLPRRSATWC